jgi:8-oxo-dGTP diphosphatase
VKRRSGWLTDREYEFIFRRTPRLCVDLIVVNREGEFLLAKRSILPYRGKWSLPGGKVGYKESVAATLKRVAAAELGATIASATHVGYIEFLRDGKFLHSVSIAFRVRLRSSRIKALEQATALRWFKKIPRGVHPAQGKFLRANRRTILPSIH